MFECDRDHNEIVDMIHVLANEPFRNVWVDIVDDQISRGTVTDFGSNKRWKVELTIIP